MNKLKLGLLWHGFKSGNQGVNALSISNITILDEILNQMGIETEYLVLGPQQKDIIEEYTANKVTVNNIPRYRKMLLTKKDFIRSIKKCDAVFDLSEGDSFTDIYGWKRFITMTLTKSAVIGAGKPLVLCPQTIGPFNNVLFRHIAKNILKDATLVFARDKKSKDYCDTLIGQGSSKEATDVAFALPYHKESFGELEGNLKIGINISGLLYNGGYTGNNQFSLKLDYKIFLQQLLKTLNRLESTQIYLVPHVYDCHDVEDDRLASQEIIQNFPNITLAPKFENAVGAKSFISNMDVFIGSRMHSTIAAFSSGIPVIPVAYSRKFEGLFSSLGYNYVIDAQQCDENEAVKKILEYLNQKEILKQKVNLGMSIAREQLDCYRKELKIFFRSLCNVKR